jgi:polyisoprenoid-binding protein YceI
MLGFLVNWYTNTCTNLIVDEILFSFLVLLSSQFVVSAQKKFTPVDASVGFTIKNFGLTVDGSLSDLKGTITIDEKKQLVTSIDTVDVTSIDTKKR